MTNIIQKRSQIVGFFGICIFMFVAAYYETFWWLYERYTAVESYYSHGFLIPFITGYFIYKKKDRLAGSPVKYSYWGLILILNALLLHLLSVIVHVFFLSGFSILLLFIGICLFLYGSQRTKIILIPLLYLIFMFPLPLVSIQKISLPLKSIVTHTSVGFANLIGIQAIKSGYIINLPDGDLAVGNPCSGLRSIFSFLALGSVFLIENRPSVLKSFYFLFLCVAIAVFSNILRVIFLLITGTVSGVQSVLEGSFFHDYSGYAVFIVGLIMMITLWKAIR